jgi:hypothetical protein
VAGKMVEFDDNLTALSSRSIPEVDFLHPQSVNVYLYLIIEGLIFLSSLKQKMNYSGRLDTSCPMPKRSGCYSGSIVEKRGRH